MSVGKGSIQRAAQTKDAAKEVGKEIVKAEAAKPIAAKPVEAKPAETKPAAKPAAKKAPVKKAVKAPAKSAAKPAAKPEEKTPVVNASVITSDSIHEMKFQAASNIHCDLPIYLL